MGRVCRNDFSRTSLAAIYNGLKVQLASLFEIEKRRLSQEMDLAGAPMRGMPR